MSGVSLQTSGDASGSAASEDPTLSAGAREEAAPSSSVTMEQGAVVGRYVVLSTLGAGGMGVVYAAYDPELDRKVALKLLRSDRGSAERERRLLREAQALARLSHPNVVTVHDVGDLEGRVWLAMEFVEGQTLREWSKAESRRLTEIVEVMVAAAQGLAAAHAAGLVHRDFKPDNVMVGADGRVRVMDFGLARADASGPESSPADEDLSSDSVNASRALTEALTVAGKIMGTPGYMAPEQFAGKATDAKTDQFAYCITFWEAVFGERPYGGDSPAEILYQLTKGRRREPPPGRPAPAWIRRLCDRGLQAEPSARFESMAALLAELERGQRSVRSWRLIAGAAVLGVGALGAYGWQQRQLAARVADCEAGGAEIASVWNDEIADRASSAMRATGVPYAETTVARALPRLTEYAAQWRDAKTEVCLDTEVRRVGDPVQRALADRCLDERRIELGAVVQALEEARARVMPNAQRLVVGLREVEPCRNAKRLAIRQPLPAEAAGALAEALRGLADASVLRVRGEQEASLAAVRRVLEQAGVVGWGPLLARARLSEGQLHVDAARYHEAYASLRDGYLAAVASGDHALAAETAANLIPLLVDHLGRYAEARTWAGLAEVAFQSLGEEEHSLARAELVYFVALADAGEGKLADAEAGYRQALEMRRELLGPDDDLVATSLNGLGNALWLGGDNTGAKEAYEQALAIRTEVLGSEHPECAKILNNLANATVQMGRPEEGQRLYERALAIQRANFGAGDPRTASTLANLASLHVQRGHYDAAEPLFHEALRSTEASLGPDHPSVASVISRLGELAARRGDDRAARELLVRAESIVEKSLGPNHPRLGHTLTNLAAVEYRRGALGEARRIYERLNAIDLATLGPANPETLNSRLWVARIDLETQHWDEAIAGAKWSLLRAEEDPQLRRLEADARFILAEARWGRSEPGSAERTQALADARQARTLYRELDAPDKGRLPDIEAWLAAHER